MSLVIDVAYKRRTYQLVINDESSDMWLEMPSCMMPSEQVVGYLNRHFVDNRASEVMECWGKDHQEHFYSLLRKMGATDADLIRIGLGSLVELENSQFDESEDYQKFWPRSPLHVMGYRVGKSGLCAEERRAILRDAFTKAWPRSVSLEWGLPGSGERLIAIVKHIQEKCSCNPNTDGSVAYAHWKADVEWMKATFYDGQFTFDWPGTELRSVLAKMRDRKQS